MLLIRVYSFIVGCKVIVAQGPQARVVSSVNVGRGVRFPSSVVLRSDVPFLSVQGPQARERVRVGRGRRHYNMIWVYRSIVVSHLICTALDMQ